MGSDYLFQSKLIVIPSAFWHRFILPTFIDQVKRGRKLRHGWAFWR
jgi:hypothetical protein